MQLAKNLYLWPQRSYPRKMLEVPFAYLISALWDKKVVMETYLNIAPWGPVVGAEDASQHYFKKGAADLTRWEAILLAAALPILVPAILEPELPSRIWRIRGPSKRGCQSSHPARSVSASYPMPPIIARVRVSRKLPPTWP